jgi:hypothetical protein
MLVISNGAYKSGSTWLFKILYCITQFSPPPKEYLNSNWYNPSINPDKLSDLLNNCDYSNNNYLSKNHFGLEEQQKLILNHKNVLVLDIERNLRDVVVSAYYHNCRIKGYQGNFSDFYWKKGRLIANRVRRYHRLWKVNSPQIYVASYEHLKYDFASEVKEIAKFIGYNLSDNEINQIQAKTDKKNQKESGVFRKGIVGDWKNHFDQKIIKDIELIEKYGLANPRQMESEEQQPTKDSDIDLNTVQRVVVLFHRVANFYLRWPVVLAGTGIMLNTTAMLDIPFRWALMMGGTSILFFLVGYTASKAELALKVAENTSKQAKAKLNHTIINNEE